MARAADTHIAVFQRQLPLDANRQAVIVMAYIVMADIVVADIVMTCTVTTCIVMALYSYGL